MTNGSTWGCVGQAHSWGDAATAMLLSAFSLGYVPVQIPASLLARSASSATFARSSLDATYLCDLDDRSISHGIARRIGEKVIVTVNLLANAVLCLAMPAVARGGPVLLAACFATMGCFQGCRCAPASGMKWARYHDLAVEAPPLALTLPLALALPLPLPLSLCQSPLPLCHYHCGY